MPGNPKSADAPCAIGRLILAIVVSIVLRSANGFTLVSRFNPSTANLLSISAKDVSIAKSASVPSVSFTTFRSAMSIPIRNFCVEV